MFFLHIVNTLEIPTCLLVFTSILSFDAFKLILNSYQEPKSSLKVDLIQLGKNKMIAKLLIFLAQSVT